MEGKQPNSWLENQLGGKKKKYNQQKSDAASLSLMCNEQETNNSSYNNSLQWGSAWLGSFSNASVEEWLQKTEAILHQHLWVNSSSWADWTSILPQNI